MENEVAKDFVELIFSLIEEAKCQNDIENIIDNPTILKYKEILKKNFVKTETFPQIDFRFSENEISVLEEYFENGELRIKESKKFKDPLLKLLYSLAWKNGDLGKIKHIYNGIIAGLNEPNRNVNQAIVFHQFGKHLSKPEEQPIIDQHVIRAYAFYVKVEERNKFRKLKEITNKHNDIVNSYVVWI